ncbi:MAG TPA: D-alanine--D-alanine ligase [Mogibacterium sp.]|nr:D-alanine--D-alanine ligase [Mogibacterium sp.]
MKTRIAVIFGGKSVEHEVSVISAIQAVFSMDTDKYQVIPVYMTKSNDMYIGEDVGKIESYKNIPSLLSKSQRVIMLSEGNKFMLVPYDGRRFGRKKSVEFDMAFPIVHGTNVEDGALQGYLKTVGVPFVGPDVTPSAVGMDKFVMKAVLKEYDIPVLEAKVYTNADYAEIENLLSDIETEFGYPVIVKPINLGSSVGIGIAGDRGALMQAIDDAFTYANKIIVERAILNLREINCAVLGDENEAIASECEEPMHTKDILSYEDKYAGGGSKKSGGGSKGKASGMASLTRKIPADISKEQREIIRDMAVKAFKALGCNGVSRIDFMIDADTGKLYFNEINTIPGSLAFYLWEPVGVPYRELLDRMIQLALKRHRLEESLTFAFDTNILQNANIGSGQKGKI